MEIKVNKVSLAQPTEVFEQFWRSVGVTFEIHPDHYVVPLPEDWSVEINQNVKFYKDDQLRVRLFTMVDKLIVACRYRFDTDFSKRELMFVVRDSGVTDSPIISDGFKTISEAAVWLKTQYPDYEDPLAYWDNSSITVPFSMDCVVEEDEQRYLPKFLHALKIKIDATPDGFILTFPAGWSTRPAVDVSDGFSIGTYYCDPKGRIRLMVDPDTNEFIIVPRYLPPDDNTTVIKDQETGEVVFTTDPDSERTHFQQMNDFVRETYGIDFYPWLEWSDLPQE